MQQHRPLPVPECITLLQPSVCKPAEMPDLHVHCTALAVLGVSGVLESHSLYVAVNTLRRRAAQQGMGLLAYIKTGADPAAVAVMMEDGAAVAGLVVAGGCLALCQV